MVKALNLKEWTPEKEKWDARTSQVRFIEFFNSLNTTKI